MGRRPGDAEGAWACLAKNDPGDFAEFAADFVDQPGACCLVRFSAAVALDQQRFKSLRGSADDRRGTAIEGALPRLTCGFESGCNRAVFRQVRRRSGRERLDEAEGVANAGQP